VFLWQVAFAAEVIPAEGEALKWGTALDWAITLTIALSALILACILVSLIVYRGHQTEGSALWLHLLSLGIFPLLLLAVGNFAVLEYAKEVRFCGSCHRTMKVYIDDLHNPKSQSLAALHLQHRFAPGSECYTCHANYGVHGTFEAKLTGLRDVYTYMTRAYHLPLKMRAPFKNALCFKCHDGAKRYIAIEVHLKLETVIKDGKLPCASCHRRAHEFPKPAEAAGPGGVG
jgi:nitrate/TMAO reductase-like tetraheme cytochrome c subunit